MIGFGSFSKGKPARSVAQCGLGLGLLWACQEPVLSRAGQSAVLLIAFYVSACIIRFALVVWPTIYIKASKGIAHTVIGLALIALGLVAPLAVGGSSYFAAMVAAGAGFGWITVSWGTVLVEREFARSRQRCLTSVATALAVSVLVSLLLALLPPMASAFASVLALGVSGYVLCTRLREADFLQTLSDGCPGTICNILEKSRNYRRAFSVIESIGEQKDGISRQ